MELSNSSHLGQLAEGNNWSPTQFSVPDLIVAFIVTPE
jgi:hypothetical protein